MVLDLSLTFCWFWLVAELSRHPYALGVGVALTHHWEPMTEGCSLQIGPKGWRWKAYVSNSTFTMLGSPGIAALDFPLQLCTSAGIFIWKHSKQKFSKGRSLQKDEKNLSWDKWLIWQRDLASGVWATLTSFELAEGKLAFL